LASANVGAGGGSGNLPLHDRGARQSRRRPIRAAFGRLSEPRTLSYDERTGWTHDFTAKSPTLEASDHIARAGRHAEGSRQEVLFLGLYAPENAPDWCRGAENIERYWNAAEAAEKRKDAQIAERVIIALPKELTLEQSRWALQDHIREFTRQGRVVQVAIHSPENDQRNLHMQISLRAVDESGFKAEKAREQQERYLYRSQYVEHLRENWARVANRHLERHGCEGSLDHRSYQRQGDRPGADAAHGAR
jgi:hypothetical protein